MKKLSSKILKTAEAEKHIQENGYTNIQIIEKPEEGWSRDISFDYEDLRVIICFKNDQANPIGLCFKKDEPDEVDNPIKDFDIQKVLEPEISIFIQLNNDKKTIRYFSIGTYINELFTGMVYGYEGGGESSDRFVYKNKFLPSYIGDEPIEWDDLCGIFDEFSPYTFDTLDAIIRGYADFNTTSLDWEIEEDVDFGGKMVFSMNMHCNPISYGLTSWDDTKDTKEWEVEEIKSILKMNVKDKLHDYLKEYISVHNHIPMDVIFNMDEYFEFKVEFSEYESILGEQFESIAKLVL